MATTIKMKLEKQTKGAVQYKGLDEDSPDNPMFLVGTMYLRKAGLIHHFTLDGKTWPAEIKVTVEVL